MVQLLAAFLGYQFRGHVIDLSELGNDGIERDATIHPSVMASLMKRLLFGGWLSLLLLVTFVARHADAGEDAETATVYDRAEQAMHEGRLADSERMLLLALRDDRPDDRARFLLGIVQVLRAVENLGQAMYEYGAVSENATQPFLRLPVPRNPKPSTISYRSLGRVLDLFAHELGRAESTLAEIRDDDVVCPLRLAPVRLDFGGRKSDSVSLLQILTHFNGRKLITTQNPDFLVHFDRGDVAWLRAYCHLLSGMVEAYRSADEELGFVDRVGSVFPEIESPEVESNEDWYRFVPIVDPPRLRRMRLHFVAVCELNRETWMHIRKETDDQFEWLPHPGQTDQLGLPISDMQIDRWLRMMDQLEGLLKGERLVPSAFVKYLYPDHPEGQGLNLANVLDDPPADLFNVDRIQQKGIQSSYLEPETDKKLFDVFVVLQAFSAFNGPFGFFTAVRMN